MKKEIKMADVFVGVYTTRELLERLEEYKEDGIGCIQSYGFQGIDIDTLIKKIKLLMKENLDVEEISRAILFQIHY